MEEAQNALPQEGESKIIERRTPEKVKLLKNTVIIVIIFILVLGLAELGYYIFRGIENPFIPKGNDIAKQQAPIDLDKITPAPIFDQKETATNVNTEVLSYILDTFEVLKEKNKVSFLNEATVQSSMSGTYISGSEVSETYGDYTVVYYILLRGIEGKDLRYAFTAEDLLHTKITRTASGNESEILINEIQPGDSITIKSTIGLLDTSEPIKIELEARETI